MKKRVAMTSASFLSALQSEMNLFENAVATDEGQWIIKGFIDVHQKIYTISLDTKIISKVIELLLFPMLKKFGEKYGLKLE